MKVIDIIIETPKGSTEKYSYEPDYRLFRLKKILPLGMIFPYDFGFVPYTKGEDGDPLDVIVFSEFKSFPGCLVECRIIGAILAKQSEKGKKIRNDRFLAVPTESSLYRDINSFRDFPPHIIKELEDFFENYNSIEGKKFLPIDKIGPHPSFKLIQKNLVANK